MKIGWIDKKNGRHVDAVDEMRDALRDLVKVRRKKLGDIVIELSKFGEDLRSVNNIFVAKQLSDVQPNHNQRKLIELLREENIPISDTFFETSDTAISNFYTNNSKFDGWRLYNGIYLWLIFTKNAMFIENMNRKELMRKEKFAVAAREILGRDNHIDPGKIHELKGVYEFYRPYFGKPLEETMICKLAIGQDAKQPLNCELAMTYKRQSIKNEIAEGKITPVGSRSC
jgi:hypothetical protein